MSVRKRGNKYEVTNKAGTKILGTHSTKKDADRQLRAVEANKNKSSRRKKK